MVATQKGFANRIHSTLKPSMLKCPMTMYLPHIRNGRVATDGSGASLDRLRSDPIPSTLITLCQHVAMVHLGFFFHKLMFLKNWPQKIVRDLGKSTGKLRIASNLGEKKSSQ